MQRLKILKLTTSDRSLIFVLRIVMMIAVVASLVVVVVLTLVMVLLLLVLMRVFAVCGTGSG